jgi:apolipoprotein N-acyltransferase
MAELLKLVFDMLVLRDSTQKGEMTAGVWVGAGLFLLGIACIGVPTILYFDRHPDAPARLLIGPAIALGLLLVVYFFVAIHWRLRLKREHANQDVK